MYQQATLGTSHGSLRSTAICTTGYRSCLTRVAQAQQQAISSGDYCWAPSTGSLKHSSPMCQQNCLGAASHGSAQACNRAGMHQPGYLGASTRVSSSTATGPMYRQTTLSCLTRVSLSNRDYVPASSLELHGSLKRSNRYVPASYLEHTSQVSSKLYRWTMLPTRPLRDALY
jgi:hypothetical protein